ncbi:MULTISPECIES: SDR family oxidoreductase [unclassified Novosphingobium]|uniref:SDR family oxidoreductase n=1 Tax=unclassified Novosphingobium TaxID=2644732 RepID=UPI00187E7C99|nr:MULTISPECIES: SDR family oxidoreductase [unclassified Novosphingobium]MCW1384510.1 SDR family oxidoreductase [Novosphingobium sp. KCTC 2891]QOV96641.1 SDR family oxidoreductase [Novosphingobium sp. ES2-1]
MDGRFGGKVVIVTGASSGIGKRTAERLVAQGAVVHGADLTSCGLAGMVDHICDVTSEDDWIALVEAVTASDGRIDGLVNAAGVIRMGTTIETTIEDFRLVMRVNVEGTFLGCKHVMRAMQVAGTGSIVNLSSTAGLRGSPGAAAYTASKGAVRLLTKTAALEAIAMPSRIRVNSVHPALTQTPMADAIVDQLGGSDEIRGALNSLLPAGRLAEPDEIAAGILFLLSDDASYMSGAELVIDNGFTAR